MVKTKYGRRAEIILSLEEVIERLEKSKKLFALEKLSGSIEQIDIMINELKTTKNLDTINYAFKTLQTSLLVGYNNGISHRIQLSNFYSKRFNSVTKTNAKSFAEEELDKQWAKIIIQRGNSRQVIFALDKILKEGVDSQFKVHKDDAKHDNDRAISIAYLYLVMIDGIYGKNLKDILILDTLYKHEIPDLEKLKKMDMRRIKEYFEKIDHSECLFDGFDYHIRNAIAHSSFWYDAEQKVIHFEDRYRNPPVTKEVTIDELYEMSVKLSDIDVLVFYYGEIQIINIELKKGLGLSIS